MDVSPYLVSTINDGSLSGQFSSSSDDGYIIIEFDKIYFIDRIKVFWGGFVNNNYITTSFEVYLTINGVTTSVYTTASAQVEHNRVDAINLVELGTAQFSEKVVLHCKENTGIGYSLYELEAYGSQPQSFVALVDRTDCAPSGNVLGSMSAAECSNLCYVLGFNTFVHATYTDGECKCAEDECNPSPDSDSSRIYYSTNPDFHICGNGHGYTLLYIAGRRSCHRDLQIMQPCTNESPCSVRNCKNLCEAKSSCNAFSRHDNGQCFLYRDCSHTQDDFDVGFTCHEDFLHDWVRTSHSETTACELDSLVYGDRHSNCTIASTCTAYCRSNYPSAQFAEFWPNDGEDGECSCNCYTDCDQTRCVSAYACSSLCEETDRWDCPNRSGGNIEIYEWTFSASCADGYEQLGTLHSQNDIFGIGLVGEDDTISTPDACAEMCESDQRCFAYNFKFTHPSWCTIYDYGLPDRDSGSENQVLFCTQSAQFTPINRDELMNAIQAWEQDSEQSRFLFGLPQRWNTHLVTSFDYLFSDWQRQTPDISSWDTSAVTSMECTFNQATEFNININSWDTSAVTTMVDMFKDAREFDQELNSWNTSSVTSMDGMFHSATSFNKQLSWDVSQVESMKDMFSHAWHFNQDINGWNTASLKSIQNMFNDAMSFNNSVSCLNFLSHFTDYIGEAEREAIRPIFEGTICEETLCGVYDLCVIEPNEGYCIPQESFPSSSHCSLQDENDMCVTFDECEWVYGECNLHERSSFEKEA